MGKCVKLQVLWDFLDELMAVMNIGHSFSHKRTVLYEFEVMNIKCQRNDIKTILYLTTIVNYHLWKTRNRCVHEGQSFDCNKFVNGLIKSAAARKRLQTNVHLNDLKVDRIAEILSTMILLRNITFSFDNG